MPLLLRAVVLVALVVLGAGASAPPARTREGGVPPLSFRACPPSHPIKGNLTTKTGECIYHVRGGFFYDRTEAGEVLRDGGRSARGQMPTITAVMPLRRGDPRRKRAARSGQWVRACGSPCSAPSGHTRHARRARGRDRRRGWLRARRGTHRRRRRYRTTHRERWLWALLQVERTRAQRAADAAVYDNAYDDEPPPDAYDYVR